MRNIAKPTAFFSLLLAAFALFACVPARSSGEVEGTQTPIPVDHSQRIAVQTNVAGTATSLAGDDTPLPEVSFGELVDTSLVSPISASFFQERQATEYTVEPGEFGIVLDWDPTSCGTFSTDNEQKKMTWGHAHPPCDETTGHVDELITATLLVATSNGTRMAICNYRGAANGTGEACIWDELWTAE